MTNEQLLKLCRPLSVMGPKLEQLLSAAQACDIKNERIAEVGVYRGGSALLLALAFPRSKVIGFDTYEGMPFDDSLVPDGHKKGDFADTNVRRVIQLMQKHGAKNFHPIMGPFEPWDKTARFKFVHLDADLYQSTRDAVDYFEPRLLPGGGFFFDDYTSGKCAGVRVVADTLYAAGGWTRHCENGTMFLKRE